MSGDRNPSLRTNVRFPLFMLGCAYALICALFLTAPLYRYKYESLDIASSLAENGAFANPYQFLATGPTAHLAPLYPGFLSIFFWLFKGQIVKNYLAVSVVTAGLFGTFVTCLPRLAAQVFRSRAAGLFAAVVLVTLPVVQILPGWEVVPLSLCLVGFCTISLAKPPRPWLLGVLGATVSMLNVPAIVFIGTWSIGLTVAGRLKRKVLAKAFLLCCVLCLPWMIRNLLTVGSFCIRDNLGLELQVSNNDQAKPLLSDNLTPAHELYHPNLSLAEAVRVRQLGEVEYNRQKLHQVISWIKANPARFATLSLQHVVFFWFPDQRLGFSPAIWILTLLSIPAAIVSLRTLNPASVLLLSMLAYSLPYVAIQADLRYRTPILWVTALFAGHSVQMVLAWLRSRRAHNVGTTDFAPALEHASATQQALPSLSASTGLDLV